ncbi:MAG: hypothetical protein CMF43_01310 [Legionellales bacterium]|nr:hypothetical protein [Legionellales bacterium]
MHSFKRITTILLTSVVLSASDLFAWGLTGHRIVGAIAEKHLDPIAAKHVSERLGGYHLQDVSNWADEIKSERTPFVQSLRNWHYIDVKRSGFGQAAAKKWPTNLYQALNFIIKRLEKRQFDAPLTEDVLLRLLVHLVADAHQPLHVGNGQDLGGNICRIRWFGSRWTTSLHSIWDTKLIDSYKLTYTEYADYLDHASTELIKNWQSMPVKSWLKESLDLHRSIYPADRGYSPKDYCVKDRASLQDNKIPSLGFAYQHAVRPILHQRLLQAGIRLAGILNRIYGDDLAQISVQRN